jgi:hypothetical protein
MAYPKQVTDEKLLSVYKETGSLWKTADQLKICGQSVHERLVKLNAITQWRWTEEEDTLLVKLYEKAGENKTFLDELEVIFKRHKSNICRRARKLNLTKKSRKHEDVLCQLLSEIGKKRISEHGHNKGMLGKTHTPEMKAKMVITSKARADATTQEQWSDRALKSNATRKVNGTTTNSSENGFSRTVSGKRKDLDCFFRSKTEANYARFLNHIGVEWVYEPKVFFFDDITRGTLSYTPDFYCPGIDKWYEVKGWMDGPSTTRLKRFKKYHPIEADKLVIVAQSKKTYGQALELGYDVIRYEDVEKQYKNLPRWE